MQENKMKNIKLCGFINLNELDGKMKVAELQKLFKKLGFKFFMSKNKKLNLDILVLYKRR
jgi:hypothetical protein